MNAKYLIKHPGADELILFFSGWSTDDRPFRHLADEKRDILILFDYTVPDTLFLVPEETPETSLLPSPGTLPAGRALHAVAANYQTVHLIAWSLGVAVAERIRQAQEREGAPFPPGRRIALNGTLLPIHDRYGIPEAVFNGTLENMPAGLAKFNLRMCGGKTVLERYTACAPARSGNSAAAELASLKRLLSASPDIAAAKAANVPGLFSPFWDTILISDRDRIFPSESQLLFWEEYAKPHLPSGNGPENIPERPGKNPPCISPIPSPDLFPEDRPAARSSAPRKQPDPPVKRIRIPESHYPFFRWSTWSGILEENGNGSGPQSGTGDRIQSILPPRPASETFPETEKEPRFEPDRRLIRQRFSRAAGQYDRYASVQQSACNRLAGMILRLLEAHRISNSGGMLPARERILEFGCGTGNLSRHLSALHPKELLLNDLCPEYEPILLQKLPGLSAGSGMAGSEEPATRLHCHWEDTEQWIPRLLSRQERFTLIASASALQWMKEPVRLLRQCLELLDAGGILAVSTFAPGTLPQIAGTEEISLPYPSEEVFRTALSPLCREIRLRTEEQTLYFPDPSAVLHHLRATGVNGLRTGCWTRSRLERFSERYRERFALPDGTCPLTYRPLYLICLK